MYCKYFWIFISTLFESTQKCKLKKILLPKFTIVNYVTANDINFKNFVAFSILDYFTSSIRVDNLLFVAVHLTPPNKLHQRKKEKESLLTLANSIFLKAKKMLAIRCIFCFKIKIKNHQLFLFNFDRLNTSTLNFIQWINQPITPLPHTAFNI